MKKSILFVLGLIFAIANIMPISCSASTKTAEELKEKTTEIGVYAVVETTGGSVLFKLFNPDKNNATRLFIGLANGEIKLNQAEPAIPFYKGRSFYRVQKDRFVKSGSPYSKDKGSVDLSIPVKASILSHDRKGLLTMQLNGEMEADGRFTITMSPLKYLNGRSVVIGEAKSSIEFLNRLKETDTIQSVQIFQIKTKGATAVNYRLGYDLKQKTEKEKLAVLEKIKADLEESNRTYQSEGMKKLALLGKKEGVFALLTTEKGAILLELYYKKTPLTVSNFVGLAEGRIKNKYKKLGEPYYDGLKFHRVISDFMIQGGCPLGNGTGDPGYKFKDEFLKELKHDRAGILSMANSGPGTNGSQFFITHKATPWLDGKHTVFGRVLEGQDVVDRVAQNDTIIHITIIRLGDEANRFYPDTLSFNRLK